MSVRYGYAFAASHLDYIPEYLFMLKVICLFLLNHHNVLLSIGLYSLCFAPTGWIYGHPGSFYWCNLAVIDPQFTWGSTYQNQSSQQRQRIWKRLWEPSSFWTYIWCLRSYYNLSFPSVHLSVCPSVCLSVCSTSPPAFMDGLRPFGLSFLRV